MRPVWLITYEGKDVTDEIAPMVTSAEYSDHLEGTSDEFQLTLEDRHGRWREGWWPANGDTLQAQLGYAGRVLLDAGAFTVDEVSLRGKPDSVSISATAVVKGEATQSTRYRAFEGMTLKAIVETLATELELTVVGDIEELALARITQTSSTLAFLRNLAKDFGYAFSIRPPKMVFYPITTLEAASVTVTIDRTDVSSYDLKGTTQDTYVACEVSYLDPRSKALRQVRVEVAHAREAVVVSTEASTASVDESEAVTDPSVIIPTRDLREMSPMMTGDDVLSWQTFCSGQGVDPGPLDSKFGPLTRRGTVNMQVRLGTEADGIVGPETVRLAQEAGWGRLAQSVSGASDSAGSGVSVESVGRVLRHDLRLESAEIATVRARALLLEANRLKASGSLSFPGRPNVVAGATIGLTGMGRLSGKYMVQTSTHRVGRSSGYATSVEVTCV